MNVTILSLITTYTVILRTAAIIVCVLIPGGRVFAPVTPLLSQAGPENHPRFDIPALNAAMSASFRFVAKLEFL